MNILFITYDYIQRGSILLGISYISAFLKKHGHLVDILNFSLQPFSEQAIHRKIKDFSPGLIGVPILTTFQINEAQKIIKIIKQSYDIPVVVGGAVATVDPESVADCEEIEMICIGEGEYPILELVETISEQKDYSRIRNLWVKRKGDWIKNGIRPVEKNLDLLPFPDRSLFPIIKNMVVMVGRGCPYDCSYCINRGLRQLYGWIRHRSPENVVSEILELKKRYSPTRIWFRDDKFPTDEQWIDKFTELYENFKIEIPFAICIRPEEFDEKQVRKLKRIGLEDLKMGIETADEDIREKILKRKYSNALIENSFKIARKCQIRTKSYNIVGIPGETAQSILRTIALNIKLHPEDIQFTIFQPYPGTLSYKECLAKGYLLKDISSVKDMFSESIIMTEFLHPKDIKRLFLLARFICGHQIICKLASKINNKIIVSLLSFIYRTRIIDLLALTETLLGKIKNIQNRILLNIELRRRDSITAL